MKHLCLLGIGILALVSVPVAASDPWTQVATRVSASVAQATFTFDEAGNVGKCSAFAIDEHRNLFMTANHCTGANMKVDGFPASVVYVSLEHDLAVLVCYGVNMRALKPSTQPILRGTPLAAFGYGYGWLKAMFRAGSVAIPSIQLNEIGGDFYLITDFALVGGMSGGPMVDNEGNVVSINQLGNAEVGLGRPLDVIMAATAPYWERH